MHKLNLLITFLVLAAAAITFPVRANALIQSGSPSPKVSFTFDDGYASAFNQAAPILAKYGFSATDYAITDCIGMVTAPNTCRADSRTAYMTWNQLSILQNTYGWEIGSHTVTHPYLASKNASDGQPNYLTPAQMDRELLQSKADLVGHGLNVTDFSTPYGDYNNQVLASIAKYYSTQRGYADTGYNTWPYSDYYLKVQQVKKGVSPATVQSYINNAIATNSWLILVFHDIKDNAKTDGYTPANLDKVAAYVKSRNVQVVNIRDGTVAGDSNLMPSGDFANGLAGWTTDSPTSFTADSLGNGSYPSAADSVKLSSASATGHLFSPLVTVGPGSSFVLKNFLNVKTNSGGEVGFYIDEFNPFGQWISGQFKAAERGSFVEDINFSYKPSSNSVAMARLQIYITANSAITGYLDNAQWLVSGSGTPAPPHTSLLPNSNFDSGLAVGWRTDSPTNVMADAGGNGSPDNPVNSIRLTSGSRNVHLFSPAVPVTAGQVYDLTVYLSLKQITGGEVGFYIDEYDASGNWVSGQYKVGVKSVGSGNVAFNYTPTSTSVKTASLQVIVLANSGIEAYVDNTIWQ